jgi:hypothetical protein
LFSVPLLFIIDSSISTGRSSVQGALEIAINKDIDPDNEIVWDKLSGKAPSWGACGAHRTAFKEFWQENIREGDSLKTLGRETA